MKYNRINAELPSCGEKLRGKIAMGVFPHFCKPFVPVRTARNVNAISRPYGTKNPGI
jgi:hypothetical protein